MLIENYKRAYYLRNRIYELERHLTQIDNQDLVSEINNDRKHFEYSSRMEQDVSKSVYFSFIVDYIPIPVKEFVALYRVNIITELERLNK